MQEKYNLFYAWVIGQKPEISDPTNPFQCMDLAYELAFFLNFPKDTIQHTYAKDVFLKPNADTSTYFDIIPNSPSFVPQALDLAVFDGTIGHISTCNGIGDTKTFQSLDENWTSNGLVTVITHNYDNPKLLGVLRPKIQSPVLTDQTLLPIIDANGNKMEVQACRSKLADQESQIADLLTRSDNYLKEIADLKVSLTALNTKITTLQTELDNQPPNTSGALLGQLHDVLWSKGFFWIKLSKMKGLLPK